MRDDERRLLEEIRQRTRAGGQAAPRDAAADAGMSPKRCLLLCQGWWAKRWLDRDEGAARGDDFVAGRLTEAGMTAADGPDL